MGEGRGRGEAGWVLMRSTRGPLTKGKALTKATFRVMKLPCAEGGVGKKGGSMRHLAAMPATDALTPAEKDVHRVIAESWWSGGEPSAVPRQSFVMM